jgi:hypothetical protein
MTSTKTNDENVMARFGKLRDVLTETHSRIPSLLQSELDLALALGKAEAYGHSGDGLRAQLKQSGDSRQTAVRRRRAAAAAILELEAELEAGREKVQQELAARAAVAIGEFGQRYRAAVSALESLWQEGAQLAAVLRLSGPIHMPVPARPVISWDGSLKMTPVLSGDASPSSIDAEAARIGAQLDLYDESLQLVSGIKRSREIDSKHFALSARRGTPAECPGLFRCLQPVTCLLDGLDFAPSTLIDAALVGHGNLARLVSSIRFVRRLEEGTPAAA